MALLTNVSIVKPHLINPVLGSRHATLAVEALVMSCSVEALPLSLSI